MLVATLFLTATVTTTAAVQTAAPTAQALDNTPWRLPVRPDRCSVADAESGDVAGCLLSFYNDPAETGWGTPSDPGVGPGWSWNGYTYNRSDALVGWESTWIRSNSEPVAGMRTGSFESHVDAQALFEGFLNEIEYLGYNMQYASGYSFRCTSGSGGWSCPSGDTSGLSNHAWGLAIDMNAGTNPIRSYSGIDGSTACQTPIVTDLPQWAIQTAEKWGLYWGGYGWNSGCFDTTTERSRVYRDPPHFEFRGTPRQARAIAAFNLRNDPNTICRTVVDDDGADTEVCNRSGRPEAGWRTPVVVDPPVGSTAVMINLTATGADGPGFLTLESCGPVTTKTRETSALSFARGQSIATMAVVPIDADGRFCVYRSTGVHSIVDVVAYFTDSDDALWYEPSTPTRLTDTRLAAGKLGSRGVHEITRDSTVRIANIAAVDGAAPGYLQASDCAQVGADAIFSNLNYVGSEARSNLALVAGGAQGSCVFALSEAHVIFDELGTFNAATGLGWSLAPAKRMLDTRECTEAWCSGRPGAGQLIALDLNTDAPGAAVAITVTETQAPGFITVGLCSDFDPGRPIETSNLNHMKATTVTNLAMVELDRGEMCVFTLASAHVIIDVQAELVPEHQTGLTPVQPNRVHDSRED